MSFNVITYLIYLPIISFIMVKIGWLFYKNGAVFLESMFSKIMAKNINTILLTGYYLMNIGYAIITISYWEHIDTVNQIIYSLSTTIGKIILILALMHYNNIFWLNQITKNQLYK